VEVMKEYSGETTLSARWMYKESTQIHNSIRYFCCANATNISASDVAFWRRVQVVQFEVQFLPLEEYTTKVEDLKSRFYCEDYQRRFNTLEEELKLYVVEDPHLKERLDRLAPVIMSRIIKYYVDPNTSSIELRSFKAIREATARFRLANDPVFRFIKHRVVISRTPEQRSTMIEPMHLVYGAFTNWYETSTHSKKTTMNICELVGILVTMGFEVYGEGSDQVVHGMKLKLTVPTIANVEYAQVMYHHQVSTLDEQKAALQLNLR
jgi:phage/plasmid-associated DNA primase